MRQRRMEIQLPPELSELLDRAAEARGITKTAMVNVAIYDYLHGVAPTTKATVTAAPVPDPVPDLEPAPLPAPKPEGPVNQVITADQLNPPQDPVEVPEPAPAPMIPVLSAFYRGEGHSVEVELTDSLAIKLSFLDAKELAEAFPEEVCYDAAKDRLWMTRSGLLELATVFDMEDKDHLSFAIRNLLERIDSGLDPSSDQEHPD